MSDSSGGDSPDDKVIHLKTGYLPQSQTAITTEDRANQQHRLRQEALENQHKRWRASVLFSLALLAISVIFVLSIIIIRDPNTNPTEKKWATAIMTSIATGLVGYVTGKAT